MSRRSGRARRALLAPIAAAAAAALVAGCDAASVRDDAPADAGGAGPVRVGTVERVSDGDTVRVRIGGITERVRLLGINAPEREREDHAGECWAQEATDTARDLLPEGARVSVVADPGQGERDQYDRLLGFVYRGGDGGPGTGAGSVNLALVEAGAARVYVYRRNPFSGADRFRAAEREARDGDRGLWGPPCHGGR